MSRPYHLALRAISEGLHRVFRAIRWGVYTLRAFIWHRPVPFSTVIHGRLDFAHVPCRVQMGGRCSLGDNVYFSTGRGADIVIGERVSINRNSLLVASERIEIGDNVAMGEFVSIRDQAHNFDPAHGVRDQGFEVAPVKIGKNCWIGRGVFIGPGTEIGEGSVIGANSVVHGTFPGGVLIAGAPATVRKTLAAAHTPTAAP